MLLPQRSAKPCLSTAYAAGQGRMLTGVRPLAAPSNDNPERHAQRLESGSAPQKESIFKR